MPEFCKVHGRPPFAAPERVQETGLNLRVRSILSFVFILPSSKIHTGYYGVSILQERDVNIIDSMPERMWGTQALGMVVPAL